MHDLPRLATTELLTRFERLVDSERAITADLVACLAELDERGAHLELGYSSLFALCTERYGLSEDAAFKRIRAARVVRRVPEVLGRLRSGALSLSGLVALAPHLESDPELLSLAEKKSVRQIETLIASRHPDPDSPRSHHTLRPCGPDAYKLELVLSGEQAETLERARALSLHREAGGDLAEVVGAALQLLVAKLERDQFAMTDRPRQHRPPAAKSPPSSGGTAQRSFASPQAIVPVPKATSAASPKAVPAALRRAIYQRDGGQCRFVGPDGQRCTAKAFLQIDHIVPRARGGEHRPDNLRLLCSSHNLYAARQVLGAQVVDSALERARETRRQRQALEADLASALARLGFSAAQAREATRRAATEHPEADSIPELIRPALALLCPAHSIR